jgi:heme a synthase
VSTPFAWLAERWSTSARHVRTAAGAAVATSVLIILTGGVVRVTGSGLGCPDWPNCTDSTFAATPATGLHGAIEFSNRMLTGLLCVVVGWLIIAARLRRPLSRPILRGAWLQFWVIMLNAVVGGITVWLRLSPYVVAAHFLAAVVLLTAATVTWDRSRREENPTPAVPPRCRTLGTALLAVTGVLLVVGTAVAGTGPHAGDSSDVARMPFNWDAVTAVHASLAGAVVALTVLLLVWLPAEHRRRTVVLVAALVGQAVLGILEVLTHVNDITVVLHVFGSALVWTGAVRVYLDTRTAGQPAAVARERLTPSTTSSALSRRARV